MKKDVRFLTRSSVTHAIAPFDCTLYSTAPRSTKSLKIVISTSNTSCKRTVNSFQDIEAVTTNCVTAGPRPVGSTETLEGDDMPCKVSQLGKTDTLIDR